MSFNFLFVFNIFIFFHILRAKGAFMLLLSFSVILKGLVYLFYAA